MPTLVSSWGQFGLECSSRGCTIIDDKEARNPKNVLNGVGMVLPIVILVVADVSIIWKVRVGVIINFTFDRLELKVGQDNGSPLKRINYYQLLIL